MCIDLSTNVLDLPHHNVTIVESELFDPALNCYIGDNKEEDSDNDDLASSSEPQAEEAPRRRVNIRYALGCLLVFDELLLSVVVCCLSSKDILELPYLSFSKKPIWIPTLRFFCCFNGFFHRLVTLCCSGTLLKLKR